MLHYALSNEYLAAPFIVNGISYKTPEHYFQSEMFSDPIIKQRIINADTSSIAQQLANSNRPLMIVQPSRTNNSTVVTGDKVIADKNNVMLKALRAKFSQHWKLGAELISTTGKQLINHTIEDSYWGDGGDGSGENYLGKLLEQVRDELNSGTLTFSQPFYE